ncbi:MAG: transcriptional regulator, MerR family protein [Caulobacter sp.]|nr:transcriptional regulator, MerR family protein [Caulobacter sp.]
MSGHDEFKPIEIARRVGVTIRALRLYERHGLLKPRRDANGWRVYGLGEIARLQQVLALKQMGLPLARIGELLSGKDGDLTSTLEIQEAAVRTQLEKLEAVRSHLGAARARLARGDVLPAEVLIDLARRSAPPEEPSWALVFEPLFRKHLRPDQLDRLLVRRAALGADEAVGRTWEGLVSEARRLLGTDPSAPAALDLARHWRAAQAPFTGGDPALAAGVQAAWREAIADPGLAGRLPIDAEVYDFLRAAGLVLKACEMMGAGLDT